MVNQLLIMEVLNNFKEIEVVSPSDKIIEQIRELISSGQIKPGDKLPPERKLSEKFGVGRSYVRNAIRKLEFYGIVKTLPQSGTVVSGLGVIALEGLINNVLQLVEKDWYALVETRVILEVNAAMLAAQVADYDSIRKLEDALIKYRSKVDSGAPAVEEDLLFHLQIAEISGNSVLKSLLLIIIPDIIQFTNSEKICSDGKSMKALKEHEVIFEAIKNKQPKEAGDALRAHLNDVLEFAKKHSK